MQTTTAWEELRRRNGWQNLFLPREEFVEFLGEQEQEIRDLMFELGFLGSTVQ
jgi:putative tricarboxylic transport membrane protein